MVPKDALRYIRYLEVVFEQFESIGHLTWCPDGSSELMDWNRTIEAIKPHLVSPALAIRMSFPCDMLRIHGHLTHAPEEELVFSEAEFHHRKTCYFNTVLPLQQLGRLQHLLVDIGGGMEEPGGGFQYAREWSQELVSTIMRATYDPPFHDSYDSDKRRLKLAFRTGRWVSDHYEL